jgi:hypothetical protein
MAAAAREKAGWEQEDRSVTLHRWELVKRLQGENAIQAKNYLAQRDGPKCQFCKIIVKDVHRELEFHHINGDRRFNRRWNLHLSHHSCNSVFRHRQVDAALSMLNEGDRENAAAAGGLVAFSAVSVTPWSSREGEKHDVMRSKWNGWISDFEKGPFRGEGGVMRFRDLVEMAPRMLGLGSSQTYRRYANEDRWGPLEIFREDGILFVRYRGLRDTSC